MVEVYGELFLYMGLCDNCGIPEGRFDFDRKDGYSRDKFMKAMGAVRQALDDDRYSCMRGFVYIQYGYFSFVKNEGEARRLIEFAIQNIEGSREVIGLIDSMHGKLKFDRKIRFDGATEDKRNYLVQKINESGFGPISFNNGYGVERTWERALKFFLV